MATFRSLKIRSTQKEYMSWAYPWAVTALGMLFKEDQTFLLLQFLFAAEEINHSLLNLLILPYGPGTEIKYSVITPSRSRDMINAISKAGGSPKYSEIKGRGHNSWVDCWNTDELWKWLYSQSRE